ncbi:unnamed protein product [Cylindrotheca closterium]|uniref:Uncharacterized protein n=1 Tax=Cylindrotheca closterium TaxID=2856 RepID=A0AAD2CAW2_9STRA|nr:unnamed protein product [Cylindrotheca closterium]
MAVQHSIGPYKKNLEGVCITSKLKQLWSDCYENTSLTATSTTEGNASSSIHELQSEKEKAMRLVRKHGNPKQTRVKYVPFEILRALELLVEDGDQLENGLRGSSLYFTPPPQPQEETDEQRRYRLRIDRLKLRREETKYSKLTSNLQSKRNEDDITAKSMTYAASVGLNMIIAPLSFGCFMYFFAGGIFDYLWGDNASSRTPGGTDIKRVIVGVVSGVIMLFIEMILFVIRTHEFEVHQRRKQKKKGGVQPFGVYSKKISDPVALHGRPLKED